MRPPATSTPLAATRPTLTTLAFSIDSASALWASMRARRFGIATSLEYGLHPVGPVITGGVVAHPLSRALDVLRFFRDTCAELPDEMMLVAGLQTCWTDFLHR